MSARSCKNWYLPFLLCLALVFALVMASPVSADDGLPVDPPAVEEVTTPPQTDAPPPVEEAPTSPEETPVVEDPIQVDVPPVEEPAPLEESTVQEVTTAVADAGLELVDSTGTATPMATRDTSLGVVEGDPYFKVGGTEYHFTAADCDPGSGVTSCLDPIQAALDYMESHNLTPTDRKLYIESVDDVDEDYKEDVLVNGMAAGVKGLLALVGEGDSLDDVMLYGTISVFGMPSGFSINNMSVFTNSIDENEAAITFAGNKGLIQLVDVNATSMGQDGIGIVVTGQAGNVELNRVAANNNGYNGALITVSSGTVKVTNSEFNHNMQNIADGWSDSDDIDPMETGLRVWSTNGAVTIYGVEASDNGYIDGVLEGNTASGAMIFARTSMVSVKNSVFNYNGQESGGDGLYIDANIQSLDHVVAWDNGWNGITSEINTSFTGNNLAVQNNGITGLSILGCFDWLDTDIYCDNPGPGTVTIKDSTAENNGYRGFDVTTKGAIAITNSWSGFNLGGSGYYLDNQFAPAPASVTVTNSDAYRDDYGFEIHTRGAVTLTDFSAAENFSDGILIDSQGTGAVTLTNLGTVFNELRKNGGDGYHITSLGPVSITNTDSYENANFGGYIDNSSAASAAPVTIKVMVPATTSNGFWNNAGGGLYVDSRGIVTISNIIVENNGGTGASIDNTPPGTAAGVAVTISNAGFRFNTDGSDLTSENGLEINSKGAITLTNIMAMDNNGIGVYLNNKVMGTTAGVTINPGSAMGYGYFVYNADDGLVIRTNGAVTLANINATENGDYGVLIDNSSGTAGVTIKSTGTWGAGFDYNDIWSWGNSFSRSGYDGLSIISNGPVSVTVHQARENQDEGIRIIATGGPGVVTVTGTTSSFAQIQDNGTDINEDGIHIEANGLITLTNIEARGNYAAGAYLINTSGTGGVTLTQVYLDNNYAGLLAYTNGAVVWKTGSASNNYAYGAEIHNFSSILPYKPVTISTVYTSNNGETGLFIESKGAVTLTNAEANNNSANYYLIEYGDQWVDNMSPDQTWFFNGLMDEDVTIQVNSINFTPTVVVFDSDGNWLAQAEGGNGQVELSLIDLPADGEYRIQVKTDMGWDGFGYDISIYEGDTEPTFDPPHESAANGIYVDNHNGINAPVTITTTFHPWNSNNSGTNVVVLSSGLVTLANMELNDSRQNGLYVDNTTPTSTAPGVILTDLNFNNNDQNGSTIITDGAVTMKNSRISGNGGYGTRINNDTGATSAGVTLTGVDINNSGLDGLYIRSNGSVSLTSVWSNDNSEDGIDIATSGAVTFNNVGARGNEMVGADVSALVSFTTIQPVNSWNEFSGNGSDGLYVLSHGKITLAKVRANDNGPRDEDGNPIGDAYGIYLDNTYYSTGTALVTLTNIETINNTLDGMSVSTASGITATTIVSRYNTGNGVWMNQIAGPVIVPVLTLSDINVDGNGSDGLFVDALGNIVVNKVVAVGNGGNGVNLVNSSGKGTVTLLNSKGTNFALYNGGSGVIITSKGAVTVTGLEVVGNTISGIDTDNTGALVPAAVTLNSVYSRSNGWFGNWLKSSGVVTVNNSCSIGNGFSGFDIWTSNNVFINNSSALNNNWTGFYIDLNRLGEVSLGFTAKLTNSTWYGNLRNPLAGNTNLMVVDGNKIIL